MLKNVLNWAKNHKLSLIVGCIAIGGIGYYALRSDTVVAETRYTLGTVSRGTVVTSISGSGQVAVLNQVDVTPNVSGNVLKVNVQPGASIKTGDIIAILDSRNAQKAVRDAQINYESAALSLQKLKQPPAQLSVLQAQNSLAQAQRDYDALIKPPDALALLQAQNALAAAKDNKTQTAEDLTKSYDDGFTAVTNLFTDLPTIMTGLYDGLYQHNLSPSQQNIDYYRDTLAITNDRATQYRSDLVSQYQSTKNDFDKALADFKTVSRFSATSTIETLIRNVSDVTKETSETVKNLNTFIRLYQESLTGRGATVEAYSTSELTTLDSYSSKMNTHISSLSNVLASIQNQKDALTSADRTIAERAASLQDLTDGPDNDKIAAAQERIKEAQESLAKLKAGTDPLDLKSQQLSLSQRATALADARETLSDYTVRAPIDGTVAKVNVQKGNSASGGTALATIIAKQRVATIPLNEVDVAKIKLKQKATLTFDALPDLSISGIVAEIDTLGTVSQGVVTYNVKITFDTQDERVKPGMSVTAAIITDIKQNVLTVPNGALKNRGSETYVELPSATESAARSSTAAGILLNEPLREQTVEIGLTNGTVTEVTSGLEEGTTIITRAITTAPKTSAAQTSGASLLGGAGTRSLGGTGGGGGNATFRAGGTFQAR